MQIRLFNQIFILRWWLVLITLAAFLLLIKLAWWQWQRSAEKEAQLQQIQSWQQQGPLSWPDAYQKSSEDIDGAPLRGVAHWLSPFVWLIDNQIWQGKAGYDVQIIEYNNRPGGRNWSLYGGDTYTELGGATHRTLPKDVAKNLGVSIPTLYRWVPASAQAASSIWPRV